MTLLTYDELGNMLRELTEAGEQDFGKLLESIGVDPDAMFQAALEYSKVHFSLSGDLPNLDRLRDVCINFLVGVVLGHRIALETEMRDRVGN
jgi:hypothetical protein